MKKYTFWLVLLIGCKSTVMPIARMSLIWQVNKDHMWESDWITKLLQGLDYEVIVDMDFTQYKDNSIIVVCPQQESKMIPYFKKLCDMNYKFGIILIGDEHYKGATHYYQYPRFVFRNYWHKQFAADPKVTCFMLGCKRGFAYESENQKSACQRKYSWSFAGQINDKPTRQTMVAHLKEVPEYYIHEIFTFADARSLGVREYQDLLLESVFVPCARGYWNLDSFRVCEALECGCIPIVENFPLDYFGKFLGDHPFTTISSWQEAAIIMSQLLADPVALEQRRQECMRWWAEYKTNINETFIKIIKKELDQF